MSTAPNKTEPTTTATAEIAALPPIVKKRIRLHYIGKGKYTFGKNGWPLPTRDLDPDEVKTLIRTKKHLAAVVSGGAYEIELLDGPDDLPDDEAAPAPPQG